MMFLLRSIFWLGLVFYQLNGASEPKVGANVLAAAMTICQTHAAQCIAQAKSLAAKKSAVNSLRADDIKPAWRGKTG